MFAWLDRWRILSLYQKARAAIEQARHQQALELAARLRRVGHPGGYEIEARVQRIRDQLEAAANTLQEGLAKYPESPILHFLLACTYRDQGDLDPAQESFRRAQECGQDNDQVGYQLALLKERQGQLEEALRACPAAPQNREVSQEIVELRLRILFKLERHLELLEELEACQEANSRCHGLGAQALEILGRKDEARERALLALQSDFSTGAEIQALLERVSDPASLTCRRYAIRYQGQFRRRPRGLSRVRGGISMAQVVANNQAEAIALYKRIEMTEIVRDFHLQRCEDRGPCPADQKGLFCKPRHIFY